MSGPHFRDYHLLLDEHAAQLFAMTDDIAERVRKIGGMTLRSIGQIAKVQHALPEDLRASWISAEERVVPPPEQGELGRYRA